MDTSGLHSDSISKPTTKVEWGSKPSLVLPKQEPLLFHSFGTSGSEEEEVCSASDHSSESTTTNLFPTPSVYEDVSTLSNVDWIFPDSILPILQHPVENVFNPSLKTQLEEMKRKLAAQQIILDKIEHKLVTVVELRREEELEYNRCRNRLTEALRANTQLKKEIELQPTYTFLKKTLASLKTEKAELDLKLQESEKTVKKLRGLMGKAVEYRERSKEESKIMINRINYLEVQLNGKEEQVVELNSTVQNLSSILSIEDPGDYNAIIQELKDLNEAVDDFSFEFSNLISAEVKLQPANSFSYLDLARIDLAHLESIFCFVKSRNSFLSIDDLLLTFLSSIITSSLARIFLLFSPSLADSPADIELRKIYAQLWIDSPSRAMLWRKTTLASLDSANQTSNLAARVAMSTFRSLYIFVQAIGGYTPALENEMDSLYDALLKIFEDAIRFHKLNRRYSSCDWTVFLVSPYTVFDPISMETDSNSVPSPVVSSVKFGLSQAIIKVGSNEIVKEKVLVKCGVVTCS